MKKKILICSIILILAISTIFFLSNRTPKLNKTYTTNFTGTTNFAGNVNFTSPIFQFDYSDNWKITKENTNKDDNELEIVELTNKRGVVIRYVQHKGLSFGSGRDAMTCKITKMADSEFKLGKVQDTDYSNTGKIVVAKIHDKKYGDITGKYSSKYNEYFYAIIPESYLNMSVYSGVDERRIEKFSIKYGQYLSFIAQSPNGKFTRNEEKQIVEILSSFREKVE